MIADDDFPIETRPVTFPNGKWALALDARMLGKVLYANSEQVRKYAAWLIVCADRVDELNGGASPDVCEAEREAS